MIKDIHSFSNPEEVSITHISLNLKLDFEKEIISGFADLNILNHSGSNKIILDINGLIIQNVFLYNEQNEERAIYFIGPDKKFMGNPLFVDIKPDTKKIRISYKTSKNAAALQWVKIKGRAPFFFTQSQAILARSWVPCQDSPGVKFTYDATITVPKTLIALMSAENPVSKNNDGVYQFKMKQPISSYLLALTAGNFEYRKLGRNSGVYAEPKMIEKAAWEFADMQLMIDTAEKLYGPYRWEQYDVIVLPASFPFGGMENPRLTFATPTIISGDRSLVSLIAHELAHSWSGNLVTNATWNDFWLNEGFTVYFETRIMEALYGKDYADMLEFLGLEELKNEIDSMGVTSKSTHLFLDMKDEDPDDAVNPIAYEKGRFFLRVIEELVGRDSWDKFVMKYFDTFAFKAMDTEKFLNYLDEVLLSEFRDSKQKIDIDAWIFGPGIPANCPIVKAKLFDEVDIVLAALTIDANNWHDVLKQNSNITKTWNTHQWIYFLKSLAQNLNKIELLQLDTACRFSSSANCEILFQWYILCISQENEAAFNGLENFLCSVGRRKFVKPLYAKLLESEKYRKLARDIFEKASSSYHPLTENSISQLFE